MNPKLFNLIIVNIALVIFLGGLIISAYLILEAYFFLIYLAVMLTGVVTPVNYTLIKAYRISRK